MEPSPATTLLQPSCPLCRHSQTNRLFSSFDRITHRPGVFETFQCKKCRAVFIDPWLNDEELIPFYPEHYGRYRYSKSLGKTIDTKWRRFVLENYYDYPPMQGNGRSLLKKALAFFLSFVMAKGVIPYRGEGKLLDVGCGGGSYLYRLKKRGWSVFGVEPSTGGTKQAQNLGLDVRHGMLKDAGFPDAFFDVVRLSNVLEHLTDPIGTFCEIYRILKPNGLVYITMPNTRSFVFWLFRHNWYGVDSPRHNLLYCPKTLKVLCEATGFDIASINFQAGPFNFVRSVDNLVAQTGTSWPKWLRKIDWKRNKLIRRSLKPLFFFIDSLGFGDFLHAALQKKTFLSPTLSPWNTANSITTSDLSIDPRNSSSAREKSKT